MFHKWETNKLVATRKLWELKHLITTSMKSNEMPLVVVSECGKGFFLMDNFKYKRLKSC